MRFPIPFFFVCFVLFTVFLAYKRSRQTQNQDHANTSFLERERLANATRKKDISGLDYLPFSAAGLPDCLLEDEELASLELVFKDLSDQKIIDLSAYSNTDLKLMYGPANLTALTEYDDNYHLLSTSLTAYAARLRELGDTKDATAVLEYAMQLRISIRSVYLMLAELYMQQNRPEKIQDIRNVLSTMEESFSSHVLARLEDITKP